MRGWRRAACVDQDPFWSRVAQRRKRAHIVHEISRLSAAVDALKRRKSEMWIFS